MELLACGSRSRSRTRFPLRAKAAARLMAGVVFPTPPFWLAMAITIRCKVANYRSIDVKDLFLCVTSVFSVSLWLFTRRGTEDAEVTQRLHWQVTGLADNVRPF